MIMHNAKCIIIKSKPVGLPKQFAEGKLYHICVANISHPSKTDISHFPQENISLSNLSPSDKLMLISYPQVLQRRL